MDSLTNEQKQLLFDYGLGILSEGQAVEAEALIASNAEAEGFYKAFKAALLPLETLLSAERCPDHLAEQTVQKLIERARADVESPLMTDFAGIDQVPQTTVRLRTWRPSVQVAAVAAIVMFLFSVAFPSLSLIREKAYQARCQNQLSRIYQGLTNYVADHHSSPTVKTVAGDPWWKVGYQGKENHSNTRAVWLLPKNGYVQPETFICPGKKKATPVNFSDIQPESLCDFPSRDHIDYSFRISCANTRLSTTHNGPLMSDQNPLSEKLPSDYSKGMKIRLDEDILNRNSINHQRRGQNVLYGDGSIGFNRSRFNNLLDDIFSLQTMTYGSEINGCEVPSCTSDAFLAP